MQRLPITFLCLLVVIFSIPLLGVGYYVVSPINDVDQQTWQHIKRTVLTDYTHNTVIIAIGTFVGAVTLGGSAAILVTRYHFAARGVIRALLIAPLGLPVYLVAYAYALIEWPPYLGWMQSLFDTYFYSLAGAVTLFSFCLYPYVYIASLAVLKLLDQDLLDASKTLGRWPLRIITSMLLPAAFLGGVAAVVEAATDFGTMDYLGIPTFSTGIYRAWVSLDSLPSSIFLSGYLLLGIMAMLLIANLVKRHQGRVGHGKPLQRKPAGLYTIAIVGWLITILSLALFLPVGILLYTALSEIFFSRLWPLAVSVVSTTALASVVLAVVLVIGITLLYLKRYSKPLATVKFLAAVGHALPAVSLGVLLVALLGRVGGLVLIYVYILHFAAPAWRILEKAKQQLPENTLEVAQTLGVSKLRSIILVELPLLKPAITGAGILVLLEVLKELPLALMLRPVNFETLAIQTYQLASDERLSQAAVSGSVMALMGVLMTLLYARVVFK